MAKVDIRELVDALGADLVSDAQFERNLGVALLELAEGPARTRARVIEPIAPGDERVTLPDELVHLRCAFYDARQLDEVDQVSLRSQYGYAWRDLIGAPMAFTRDEENDRTIRLVPKPTRPSELPLIPLWSPLGADFAEGAVLVIATENSDLDPSMLDWLDLWVALAVLARSCGEDSPRRDDEMAEAFDGAASGLKALLGV